MSLYFIDVMKQSPERYDLGKFIDFNDGFDPITCAFFHAIDELSVGGQYTLQGEDARPDLLSHRIYGDVQYWWILILFNGIKDITEDLVTGTEIRYPSISSIEDFYFSLRLRQKANE